MGELYNWFMNAARLGIKFLDALGHASARWASYPFRILYNAGLSAYSSRYTADYLSSFPTKTINDITSQYNGAIPIIGQSYSELEMVNFFPILVGDPYTAQSLITTVSAIDGTYNTIDVPAFLGSSVRSLSEQIDRIARQISYLERDNYYDIRIVFIKGTPRPIGTYGG